MDYTKRRLESDIAGFSLIGKFLVTAGIVDASGLARAVIVKDRDHTTLGKALEQLQLADEETVTAAIAKHLHIDYLAPQVPEIDQPTLRVVPPEFCRKRLVVPLQLQGKLLNLAMADPLDYQTVQDVEFLTSRRVIPVVASHTTLGQLLDHFYTNKEEPDIRAHQALMDAIPAGQLVDVMEEPIEDTSRLEHEAKLAPVIRLVDLILSDAAKACVSDIHFERHAEYVQVRYRVDGLLHDVLQIPKAIQDAAISRVKLTSGLDISERRKPQDGRCFLRIDRRKISLRVSTLPTQFGEKVVIRLLDNNKTCMPIDGLDFTPANVLMFKSMLSKPQGMILVTGPTGSGKTTTLYTALNWLKSPTKNIITVEDPIEYELAGINQVQMNRKAGLTFATGLRSILRQDPNVILVGEIRDLETAEMAFSAAQTGHLLLSTLHANDVTATISRLVDIGVEPFLIGSSVLGIVAQRLVRKICTACAVLQIPSAAAIGQIVNIIPADATWRVGKGCQECKQSGYKGRMAVHELLEINDEIRQLIFSRATELAIRNTARRSGMRTTMEDGVAKAARGLTTLDEVFRVVVQDEALGESLPQEDPRPSPKTKTSQIRETAIDTPIGSRAVSAGEKVLVVEDSPTITAIVKYFLELEGYQMLSAEDGRTGLELARRERPRVIITDLYMPDMDGIALIKALRADPLTREAAILMLTTETSIDTETEALSAGADDYLPKPVEPRRLAARVKSILERRREKQVT